MDFADPISNVNYFELAPGNYVADFGTGSGAYAIEMAKRVVSNGKVYAIDVQKDLLIRLKNHAQEKNIRNLECLWANFEELGGTRLADRTIDFVLISNVLFQTKAGYQVALEAKRLLKPGGRLAVIDWSESYGHLGPHPDEVVTAENAKKIFGQAGFTLVRDFSAGAHHYGLIFTK